MHYGTEINALNFGVKTSKVKDTVDDMQDTALYGRRHTALDTQP